METTMKHKHEILIKQWADGQEIQYFDETWKDTDTPSWDIYTKYRVKPKEPENVVLHYHATQNNGHFLIGSFHVANPEWQKANIELIFSGVTGKLIDCKFLSY